MVQLQRMDARLDTLSTELYQVTVCVDRIARRQATMGDFAPKRKSTPARNPLRSGASSSSDPSPSTVRFCDDDDGDDDDASDDDGDASSIDEMST